ncbi:DUF4397 domain-containing protein [Flavitalea sp. BT771]|uniref:DUF4397 domain-containing protein n=1 Tax=Flavitalea sp. BT771 TaxID=3063329 RepID=UPI0026E2BF06|nr:DUF4397 domain-containing protein [Flavitalea sp. BT771]MDO6433022.1 DUF4397 domain-containing protein [Flavitalea sp. BT771]MDV6221702.1 DUF4397 domain-containing protein [Flavitalea sp. BT771]
MRVSYLTFVVAFASATAIFSCEKTKYIAPPVSFVVINAMPGSNDIVPKLGADTAGRYFNSPESGRNIARVSYGTSQLYSIGPGQTSLTVVPITDTTFNIFKTDLTLESGTIYSFYLSGDTAHADTMMVKENLPPITDSSAGARFVNLASGGKSLTINLASDNTHTPIASLAYHNLSDFKNYDAGMNVGGHYDFEIRDQATGDSLTTFTWTYARYRCTTIVISGSTDPLSPTPLNVFAVNNFVTY